MSKQIQGLMFVRKVGDKTILVGVIDTKPELQSESQYEFIGNVDDNGNFSIQTTGNIINMEERAKGNTINGLLTSPIWRT